MTGTERGFLIPAAGMLFVVALLIAPAAAGIPAASAPAGETKKTPGFGMAVAIIGCLSALAMLRKPAGGTDESLL
jgi:ABC-type Mn2+/Zn2+ transport system permease subunit